MKLKEQQLFLLLTKVQSSLIVFLFKNPNEPIYTTSI